VTRLAPGEAGPFRVVLVEAGVRAVREKPCHIAVAIDTGAIADKRGASIRAEPARSALPSNTR
jgi:hypothetical protein